MTQSREIRLKSRPVGLPTAANFELASVDLPDPGPGQVQVRNSWMTVDPYMRGRMNDAKSYVPPFQLGEALQGGAIGEVTKSNDPSLKVGDLVNSFFGWREAFNAPAAMLQKLETHGLPPQAFLGHAGMPGLTAYVGLVRIAEMKPGDVVFVSGAAGADKVAFLKEIGVDHAIDYKAERDLTAAVMAAAPNGIDVYFENVGGAHMEAALAAANNGARFALCGMISQYNDTPDSMGGVSNLFLAVAKSLTLKGFIVSNHGDLQAAFAQELAGWVAAGKFKSRETVKEGIENAPAAFIGLFSGENLGKMLVKLG
jgi:NADPH-dependent curcumin reductase CurA